MRWAVRHQRSHVDTDVPANSEMDLMFKIMNHRIACMTQELQKILSERGQSNKGLLSSFQQSQSAANKATVHSHGRMAGHLSHIPRNQAFSKAGLHREQAALHLHGHRGRFV